MRTAGEKGWCYQSCNMELQNIYLKFLVLERYTTSVKALVCSPDRLAWLMPDTSAYYFAEDETS